MDRWHACTRVGAIQDSMRISNRRYENVARIPEFDVHLSLQYVASLCRFNVSQMDQQETKEEGDVNCSQGVLIGISTATGRQRGQLSKASVKRGLNAIGQRHHRHEIDCHESILTYKPASLVSMHPILRPIIANSKQCTHPIS